MRYSIVAYKTIEVLLPNGEAQSYAVPIDEAGEPVRTQMTAQGLAVLARWEQQQKEASHACG